jgi:hypothetical protein
MTVNALCVMTYFDEENSSLGKCSTGISPTSILIDSVSEGTCKFTTLDLVSYFHYIYYLSSLQSTLFSK